MVRESAYRQAINMPIQGSAADLTKLAMVTLDSKFKEMGKKFKVEPRQLLQIHDSILVECAEADAEKVGKIIKEVMEHVYPDLSVKIKADVGTGKNWGEL